MQCFCVSSNFMHNGHILSFWEKVFILSLIFFTVWDLSANKMVASSYFIFEFFKYFCILYSVYSMSFTLECVFWAVLRFLNEFIVAF